LKLKKFEFDIINLNEFLKKYLVSQEIILQMIFNNNINIIQFEIIEKSFKLLEDPSTNTNERIYSKMTNFWISLWHLNKSLLLNIYLKNLN